MARIPRVRRAEPKDDAEQDFDAFLGKPPNPRKKSTSTLTPSAVQRYVTETEGMIRDKEWASFKVSHVVALFMWCHEQVYDVPALDLRGGTEFVKARQQAGQLLKRQFNGEMSELVNYTKWVWQRENGREKWRRKNGKHGTVLGWRLVFGNKLVVEYRVEQARKAGEH